MKVVMITGNGGSGGLVGYIRGILSASVISNEHEVVLFCGTRLFERLGNIRTQVKVVQTPLVEERGVDIVLNNPLPEELVKMISNENPDIIVFLNGYTRRGLEAWPNVMILHNQLYVDTYQLMRHGLSKLTVQLMGFRFAVRRSMRNADGVIFLSNFSKQQADEKKVYYKNGVVIPFGFEDHNRRDKISYRPIGDRIRLLYVSAMYPYKNHIHLVRACSLLKKEGYDFELHLVGQKYKPVFKNLVREIRNSDLEDNVVFHGWVNHERIKSLIDESDIFVYASSVETTGYGLLEGMARGALIASSNEAGFPEMLRDGGVYFNPQDCQSIKTALLKLIKMDKRERVSLQEKALRYSYEYSWDQAAKQHYDYFRKLSSTFE